MNKSTWNEIYKKINKSPKLSKNIKIAAISFLIMTFTFASLLVYAGFTAINHASTLFQKVDSNLLTETKAKASDWTSITIGPDCFNTLNSFTSLQPWLANPLKQNIQTLTESCIHFSAKTDSPETNKEETKNI